ncbi:MAG: (Fe-S)-binding protein [Proteobacteria bacterium]|nr:(Fe-S)-binding protein [Pseudomonadota bacterium]
MSPFSSDSVAKQLDYCTFCPKMCRHACPVSTASGRESYIPQAKMDRLNQLRLGHPGSGSAWTTESTDPLWACTGCRHCTMYCEHDNEPGLVLLTGRAVAVQKGVTHPALANYSERFRAREQRLTAQLQAMFPDRLATEGDVGYWPGCDAIDKGAADIAAALAVFDRVGLEHVKLVDAPQACAGYPLLAAGHRDLFRWHAARVAASLRGFTKVAINCSACLYAMRAQYAAEGVHLRTEIVSLADILAPAAQNLACNLQRKAVYYHDPCHHARYNGVIEEPRRALSQLAEVRELAWNKADTECCGGGGLLPKTMPAVADQMAKRRLAEVQASGGGMVVTSCATCTHMLSRNAPPSVEVANLATAMAKLSNTDFVVPVTSVVDDDAP